MVLSTRRLMAVSQAIKDHLPRVRRISSYCLPRNVGGASQQVVHRAVVPHMRLCVTSRKDAMSDAKMSRMVGRIRGLNYAALWVLFASGLEESKSLL